MTDDQMQSLRDDIAYMKIMAQEGSRGPLLGGAILVAAGAIFGGSSIFHYLIETGVLDLPPAAYSVVWLVAFLAFILALAILSARFKRRPGARSPANRAAGTAWMGVGLAIFVMSISLGVLSWRLGSEAPMAVFPSLILALYGSGWAVSAEMSGKKWLWWLAIGGWAAAPVCALFIGTPLLWLVYAAGLFALALVPGLILMRQEPSDIV